MIDWVAAQLSAHKRLSYGHGTDNPWDEALYLVGYAAGLAADLAEVDPAMELDAQQQARVRQLLQRRIEERMPVAYLVGEAWFAGLAFDVNEDVLIPRSPLAELIEDQFSPWIDAGRIHRVLDIGTGSGCIAIATAVQLPQVQVDASDVSPAALALGERNAARHRVQDRVRFIRSDVFSAIGETRYDLIVSNPPYVDQQDMANLPREYRHEPRLGLEAGTDGLDIVSRILAGAAAHLNEGGVLIVEVGNSAEALERAYPNVPFTWLEFERGGEGVFLLDAGQLQASEHDLQRAATGAASEN
jgi:ribosomal protein L3 glutamine methyltransferase